MSDGKQPNLHALIVGISGQDGAYLSKFLINKGYKVFGTTRDLKSAKFAGLKALEVDSQVNKVEMDPCHFDSVYKLIRSIKPNEVYNLTAQSSVGLSFSQPVETIRSITDPVINILETIRLLKIHIKFYNAGSGEIFGETFGIPADETTKFNPVSPYGLAKAAATNLVAMYRNIYDVHASTGILFNHESELRPNTYVTKKIISAACRIGLGSEEKLELGNINISRDWGYAPEYVDAMWRMLQTKDPQDFVIATGKSESLKYFVEQAFLYFGLNWKNHVTVKDTLIRPAEIEIGSANPNKAKEILGWQAKSNLSDLINKMITFELAK